MMTRTLFLVFLVLVSAAPVFAQDDARFEVGVHVTVTQMTELDATDVGVSGRIAWFPVAAIGVEAELGVVAVGHPGPDCDLLQPGEGTLRPSRGRHRLRRHPLHLDSFLDHDVRIAFGAGWRF